ncbi:MAG: hypothetical protein Q8O88_04135 [bacterium]|nr:hypothetical protein [bacterium]
MDYIKDKAKFLGILSTPSRYVIIEKTIDIKKLEKEWEGRTYHELTTTTNKLSNTKLNKLISVAQSFKLDSVKRQSFEDAAFFREIERTCAEILCSRKDVDKSL